VRDALAKAGIDKPQVPPEANKAGTLGIEKCREAFRTRANKAAAGRVSEVGYIEKYTPSESLSAFLKSDAVAFGFHDGQTKVQPESWRAEFNRFLEANAQTIKFGVAAYGGISQEWLDKRDKQDPLPGIGTDPKDTSRQLLAELERSDYRLILNENDENIPPNHYIWLSVFDTLKLVEQYRTKQSGGKQ